MKHQRVLIRLKFCILLILNSSLKIGNKLKDLLNELKIFKFVRTFVLEFIRFESDDKTTYSTFSLSSKAETTINDSDIDDIFESIYGVTS